MNYGIIGVHHVGYFVKDIEKAIETFLKMGYEDCGISGSEWGGEKWHEMICRLPV